LKDVGTTSQWSHTASTYGVSVNDLFLWIVRKAVASVEGEHPMVVSAVRNHRIGVDTRNAHAQSVVALPAFATLRHMPMWTDTFKRWCGIVFWLTSILPTAVIALLFRFGETRNSAVTSNVRIPWNSKVRIDGEATIRSAFTTTMSSRTTIHLTTLADTLTISVTSRWARSTELVDAIRCVVARLCTHRTVPNVRPQPLTNAC